MPKPGTWTSQVYDHKMKKLVDKAVHQPSNRSGQITDDLCDEFDVLDLEESEEVLEYSGIVSFLNDHGHDYL